MLHGPPVIDASRLTTTLARRANGRGSFKSTLNASLCGMILTPSAVPASHSADGTKDVARSSMSSVAVAMRYRDVAAASDWLCAAFGFQKHFVATSKTGVVHYAQLTFGHAMLMLAPVRDTPLGTYMKQPDEIGGAETQSSYLLVSDADAHCARAKASGADVILDIHDDDFGGRSYACRDPEGHIWNFGTYDPWQGKGVGAQHAQLAGSHSRGIKRWALVIGLLATMVASAVVAGGMYGALRPEQTTLEAGAKEAEERAARAAQERLNAQSSAREAAERAARDAKEQLGRELTAKETAERAAEQAAKRMEEERAARAEADNFVREARQELDRMRDAKDADRQERGLLDREREARKIAERNAEQARQRATGEQSAKEAVERAAREMRGQLDREREARDVAERNAEQARQRATEEQSAKEAVERTAREMREQLDRERATKESTERDVEQYRRQASEQQGAREAAERAANEARVQLSRERSAKNAALKTAAQLRRQLTQVQYANQLGGGPFGEVESPAAEATSPLQPKLKAKTRLPQE